MYICIPIIFYLVKKNYPAMTWTSTEPRNDGDKIPPVTNKGGRAVSKINWGEGIIITGDKQGELRKCCVRIIGDLIPCNGELIPCNGDLIPCNGDLIPCNGDLIPCNGDLIPCGIFKLSGDLSSCLLSGKASTFSILFLY